MKSGGREERKRFLSTKDTNIHEFWKRWEERWMERAEEIFVHERHEYTRKVDGKSGGWLMERAVDG